MTFHFSKWQVNTILQAGRSELYSQNKHVGSLFAAMPRPSLISPSFLSDTWRNLDRRVERDTHHSFFSALKVRHKTELSVMFRQFPPASHLSPCDTVVPREQLQTQERGNKSEMSVGKKRSDAKLWKMSQ